MSIVSPDSEKGDKLGEIIFRRRLNRLLKSDYKTAQQTDLQYGMNEEKPKNRKDVRGFSIAGEEEFVVLSGRFGQIRMVVFAACTALALTHPCCSMTTKGDCS